MLPPARGFTAFPGWSEFSTRRFARHLWGWPVAIYLPCIRPAGRAAELGDPRFIGS